MRICVISYHSSPLENVGSGTSGGMTVYLRELYGKLGENAGIDIFTRGEKDNFRKGNVDIFFSKTDDLNAFTDFVKSYMECRNYDLIHTHYWLSGLIGMEIREKSETPWVHTFHTVEFLKGFSLDMRRIEAECDILMKCDLIVSPTELEARKLKECCPDARIIVIPHGVKSDNIRNEVNFPGQNILYVGRIAPIKGLDLLVDSLKYVKKEIQVNVVGGPSKDLDYYESIKSNSSDNMVKFHGTVYNGKIYSYYNNTKLVVIPSHYESFGLVCLEAMAAGKPVISFSDTGPSEIIGDECGISIRRNPRELAKAIDYLSLNKMNAYKFGMNGRKRAKAYSWDIVSRRYLDAYSRIVKG